MLRCETTDRRVHGVTPEDPGRYFGFNENSIWDAGRGTYRWSWYYFHRSGEGESWYTGQQPTMTVTEMNLLEAEALIRLRPRGPHANSFTSTACSASSPVRTPGPYGVELER